MFPSKAKSSAKAATKLGLATPDAAVPGGDSVLFAYSNIETRFFPGQGGI